VLIDSSNPVNHPLLTWLKSRAEGIRPLTPVAEAEDPYYMAGTHPEIVGWMWERLSKKFPDDARCLVYGTPCVIQPVSGVLLAVGMGTQYCLRILPESVADATAHGCTPIHRWSGGDETTNLADLFGEHWVFGSYDDPSIQWFRAAYHHFSAPPAPSAQVITPATPAVPRTFPDEMSLLVGEEPNFNLRVAATDPDAAEIATIMRGVDWSRFATVMVRKAEQRFMEVSGSLRAEDGLAASYMDGDDEFVSSTAPTLDEAIRLVQAYADDDLAYKTLIKWE
jgi:hypothetical protein